MPWMSYRRPGAIGTSRVRLTRGRRRVLLALLTGAGNLHGFRLTQAAQVPGWALYPFLDHLEAAAWITARVVRIKDQDYRCYTLTDTGRFEASRALLLR